jgi:hypothetical protein
VLPLTSLRREKTMELNWTDFKAFVVSRGLSIQWVVAGPNYFLKAFDNIFSFDCLIPVDNSISSETLDFETNFKAAGNIKPFQSVSVQSAPPFGAKSQLINGVNKKFYARNTGLQQDVTTGSNDISFTISYPWVKIIGVECIGAELMDTAELRVYDNNLGTYSGVPNAMLNQFGYTLNMGKDYYARFSSFDADIYQGMVLKITYVSVSDKRVGMNIIMNEVKS